MAEEDETVLVVDLIVRLLEVVLVDVTDDPVTLWVDFPVPDELDEELEGNEPDEVVALEDLEDDGLTEVDPVDEVEEELEDDERDEVVAVEDLEDD